MSDHGNDFPNAFESSCESFNHCPLVEVIKARILTTQRMGMYQVGIYYGTLANFDTAKIVCSILKRKYYYNVEIRRNEKTLFISWSDAHLKRLTPL